MYAIPSQRKGGYELAVDISKSAEKWFFPSSFQNARKPVSGRRKGSAGSRTALRRVLQFKLPRSLLYAGPCAEKQVWMNAVVIASHMEIILQNPNP